MKKLSPQVATSHKQQILSTSKRGGGGDMNNTTPPPLPVCGVEVEVEEDHGIPIGKVVVPYS